MPAKETLNWHYEGDARPKIGECLVTDIDRVNPNTRHEALVYRGRQGVVIDVVPAFLWPVKALLRLFYGDRSWGTPE